MLAAQAPARNTGPVGSGEGLVGTCGFMGVAAGKYAARLKAVELNATFHDQGDASCLEDLAGFACWISTQCRIVICIENICIHNIFKHQYI